MTFDPAEFRELYALGVPVELLAKRYRMRLATVRWKIAVTGAHRRTFGAAYAKSAAERHERIKANIAAYPNVSFFDWSRV